MALPPGRLDSENASEQGCRRKFEHLERIQQFRRGFPFARTKRRLVTDDTTAESVSFDDGDMAAALRASMQGTILEWTQGELALIFVFLEVPRARSSHPGVEFIVLAPPGTSQAENERFLQESRAGAGFESSQRRRRPCSRRCRR